jgi:hypothetical protein
MVTDMLFLSIPGASRLSEGIAIAGIPLLRSFEHCTKGARKLSRAKPAIFATFVQSSCAAAMECDNSVRPGQPPGQDLSS